MRFSITLSEEIRKIGNEKAKQENRSFSNYLETLILRDLSREEETQEEETR